MRPLLLFVGLCCAGLQAQSRFDYSTYLGGSGGDFAVSVAVDGAGNSYVAGLTSSIGFPFAPSDSPGFYSSLSDSFLIKLSPEGALLFAKTIVSGNVLAMLADSDGNIYLAGTARPGFQTIAGA